MAKEYAHQKQTARLKKAFLLFFEHWFAHRGTTAYIPIIFVTISMFIGSSWLIFLTSTDSARYQCYAVTFWLGSNATHLLPANQCSFLPAGPPQGPFHMLPIEYPPLTLIPFSLALLVPLNYYQWAFALLMSLVSLLAYWLLLRFGPRLSAFFFAIYLFLGALTTAQARFDLIPATLTLICLIAAERKHWKTAYIALAFGILMKLYPALFLPSLFLAEQRSYGKLNASAFYIPGSFFRKVQHTILDALHWRWKNCLLLCATICVLTGAFALLNFQGAVINQIYYFMHRPVQIETTNSTLMWLAKDLFNVPLSFTNSFGSINSDSTLSVPISNLSTACLAAGCIYVLWQQWRNKFDLTQSAIALLLLFIATGKVFSPQYLIWLIPLLAYAGAYDAFWFLLWGSICVLTTLIFSIFYSLIDLATTAASLQTTIMGLHGFFESIAIRNGLFVFVTLAYLFNWFQIRQRRPLNDAQAPHRTAAWQEATTLTIESETRS